MAYKIVLSKSAVKELRGLSSKMHGSVISHLRKLEENPRFFGV